MPDGYIKKKIFDMFAGGSYRQGEDIQMDMPTTIDIAQKKLLAQMGAVGGLAQPPSQMQAHQKQLEVMQRKMDELMRAEAQAKKEAEVWKKDEGKVMIMDVPIVQCPECCYQYEINLAQDGIRIRFRHPENKNCSKSMTEFYRPKAVFCREV